MTLSGAARHRRHRRPRHRSTCTARTSAAMSCSMFDGGDPLRPIVMGCVRGAKRLAAARSPGPGGSGRRRRAAGRHRQGADRAPLRQGEHHPDEGGQGADPGRLRARAAPRA
ncbi:MAG: hypothetical protein MZV65_48110 [Chromatiales bacterium]|nr:hypothetical protein [Chromatiales bacterium]